MTLLQYYIKILLYGDYMEDEILIIFSVFLLIASVIFITYLVLTKTKDSKNTEYVMFDFDAILKTLKPTDSVDDVINVIGFEPISQTENELIKL